MADSPDPFLRLAATPARFRTPPKLTTPRGGTAAAEATPRNKPRQRLADLTAALVAANASVGGLNAFEAICGIRWFLQQRSLPCLMHGAVEERLRVGAFVRRRCERGENSVSRCPLLVAFIQLGLAGSVSLLSVSLCQSVPLSFSHYSVCVCVCVFCMLLPMSHFVSLWPL